MYILGEVGHGLLLLRRFLSIYMGIATQCRSGEAVLLASAFFPSPLDDALPSRGTALVFHARFAMISMSLPPLGKAFSGIAHYVVISPSLLPREKGDRLRWMWGSGGYVECLTI